MKVLDKGYIELVDWMPRENMDMAVVQAARVSYLGESKGEEKDKKLLHYMLRHKHTSPFEQVIFKFDMNAPLITHWQFIRHRTFSNNYQSGRYTEFKEDEFYIPAPNEWRLQAKNGNKQMSDGILDNQDESEYFTTEMAHLAWKGYQLYQEAIKVGIAREQARLFLPGFAVYYKNEFTVDAHNLIHFMRLRLAKEAQYEIRVYAEAIWEIFQEKMPWTAEYLIENEGAPWRTETG